MFVTTDVNIFLYIKTDSSFTINPPQLCVLAVPENNLFIICTYSLELNLNITNWRESNDIPHSICSEPCPVGHIRNYQVKFSFILIKY